MVRYRAFSCFQSTAWDRNPNKIYIPKRGQGLKLRTRAKAKGQSRMVPPGGFLRGEQFERERVVPPLSRLLCLLSCRSKKVRPPAGRTNQFDHSIPLKKFMASIPASKYHPICKQSVFCPLAPSVTCGDSSLPEGAMGCVPFHMGLCFRKVPAVNPSVKNQRFLTAPFNKGASGVPPVSISHGNLLRIVTAPPVPGIGGLSAEPIPYSLFPKNARYRYCGVNGCKDLSPPCQRGVVLPLAKPGGFRGSQVSTWVCAFGKCLL